MKPAAVLLFVAVFAGAAVASPEPVTLTAGMESVPLAGHIEYLRDDSGALTLDEVRSPKFADQFTALEGGSANFGFTLSAYWYRVTFHNPAQESAQPSDWVLEVLYPTLDHLHFHLTRRDGTTQSFLTGDLRKAAVGQLPHRHFGIPLRIAAGEHVTLYLRAHTQGLHSVELQARTTEAFQAHAGTDNLVLGALLGIILVMTVYNLLIFLAIRDRAYLWYVMALGSSLGLYVVLSGYARQYGNPLFERAPGLISISIPYWWILVSLSGGLFTREFLQIRQYLPHLDRFFWIPLLWLGLIVLLFIPLIPYSHSARLAVAIFALGSLMTLAAGVHLALRGMRAAKVFLLAWGFLLGAGVFSLLTALGVLHSDLFLLYAVGGCFGVTVLSLALADRLNTERRERERFARLRQYLPGKVADLVIEGGDKALLEPKRRQVTVCVIDLRGFTPFSETSTPEDVMNVLREFFTTMGGIVEKHGGTVEHFAGDSMLIFFNAPLEIEKPELQAVQTALEMRAAFEALQLRWKNLGYELGLGIGLANGYATIGAIGFLGRSQYAAIGAVTNLSSRLCASAKHGEILTTTRVLAEVEGLVESESAGEQTIRGFTRPVAVVRVLELSGAL